MNLYLFSLLFISLNFTLSEIILNFKYNNNLNNINIDDEETFFKNLITNDMIITIQVGSEKQQIPISLKLQEYCSYLLSENLTISLPKFNSKSSSTFKILSEREFPSPVEDYKKSLKFEDNFYLNNNDEINKL